MIRGRESYRSRPKLAKPWKTLGVSLSRMRRLLHSTCLTPV